MRNRKYIITIILICAVLVGTALFFIYKKNESQDKSAENLKTQNLNADTANSNASVKDTGGQSTVVNNNPVQSSTKSISLASPTEGSKITNGSKVSGTATVGTVNYRIKDDVRGVIGQGSLGVIDGKYSGEIAIASTGEEGTFEIYSLNTSTGAEENNIKIKVIF